MRQSARDERLRLIRARRAWCSRLWAAAAAAAWRGSGAQLNCAQNWHHTALTLTSALLAAERFSFHACRVQAPQSRLQCWEQPDNSQRAIACARAYAHSLRRR